METCMTTGTRYFYFPQRGPVAVPGGIRSERLLPALSGTRRLRAGRFFRACYGALVNLTGSDLPVTDRMRMSASEP
jgi:hypothetical protein